MIRKTQLTNKQYVFQMGIFAMNKDRTMEKEGVTEKEQ